MLRWPTPICRGELVRLEPIDGHSEPTLVALHLGHGCGHVDGDGA
jgi:hypothetical protein